MHHYGQDLFYLSSSRDAIFVQVLSCRFEDHSAWDIFTSIVSVINDIAIRDSFEL